MSAGAGVTNETDYIREGLHLAGWYARADLDPGHVDGIVHDVLDLLRGHLTSEEMASHVQNWVPLGYDYPRKDPYPDTYQAARAILAEAANHLVTSPAPEDGEQMASESVAIRNPRDSHGRAHRIEEGLDLTWGWTHCGLGGRTRQRMSEAVPAAQTAPEDRCRKCWVGTAFEPVAPPG